VADGCEELDDAVGWGVGASYSVVVHGFEFFYVVLHER
jgi:hypothetical protein